MTRVIAAKTKPGCHYPGYVNVSEMGDGSVAIVVRADPDIRKGVHVCGHRSQRGEPGRCTPGDDRCNNYCNAAPEKGKMQERPTPCEHITVGITSRVVFTAEEWADVRAAIIADMGRVDTAPEAS